MPNWKAESLRVTGFASPSTTWPDPVDELWATLVGAPPEQVNQLPREGKATAEGPFESARLTIARDPGRTDIIWAVEPGAMMPFKEVPALGTYEEALRPFLDLIKGWLARGLSLSRIAWGGVLVLPVENREAGYLKLAEFLPTVKIDPAGSADLQYQINRPRISRIVEGLRVNRLCRWSVAAWRSMTVNLVFEPGAETAIGHRPTTDYSACRLEYDINSDGTRREAIAANALVPLLDEFVDLTKEISERGDIP